jgi:hypothetical protein
MWTNEHRATYRQSGGGFPSDLSDAQWARLEGLIPPATPGGRPRKTDMRATMNALFYLLRTGCPWRYLPGDPFPPRSTVYETCAREACGAALCRVGRGFLLRGAGGTRGPASPLTPAGD